MERSDNILHAVDRNSAVVDRTIDPLTDVTISSWVTVPIKDREMNAYKQRLLACVQQIVQDAKEHRSNPRFGYPSRLKADGTVEAVNLPPDSPLFPQPSETLPYCLLAFSGLHLQFFVTPMELNAFRAGDYAHQPVPDLELQDGSMGPLPMSTSYQLQYDLVKRQLQIASLRLPSDPIGWHSDGKIVSTFDLSNAQVAIAFDNTMGPPLPLGIVRDLPAAVRNAFGPVLHWRAMSDLN